MAFYRRVRRLTNKGLYYGIGETRRTLNLKFSDTNCIVRYKNLGLVAEKQLREKSKRPRKLTNGVLLHQERHVYGCNC